MRCGEKLTAQQCVCGFDITRSSVVLSSMVNAAQLKTITDDICALGISGNSSYDVLVEAWNNGNALAAVYLGALTEKKAVGNEKDLEEAFSWYSKAADAGVPDAKLKLAQFWSKGKGTPYKSLKRAISLLQKDAEQGDARAQYALGKAYGENADYPTAVSLFSASAEQEYAPAEYWLGWMYRSGLGTKKDYSQAMHWFMKAADQDYSDAQVRIGQMYDGGLGVEKDSVEAGKWYSLAAEKRWTAV